MAVRLFDGPRGSRRRKTPLIALVAIAGVFAFVVSSGAVTTVAACTLGQAGTPPVAQHLADSNFEIDAILPPTGGKQNSPPTGGANLANSGSTGCIDWADVAEIHQPDGTTGSGDNALGQGTSENDPVPTIVTDSIPPNKSDLTSFGVYKEVAGTKTFVAVRWVRINSPQGTTNMDFEFNQNKCDPQNQTGNVCSANGVTPERISGDKLLIYNLSSGGTSVAILLRTWDGSAWVDEVTLNSATALGSINYAAIGSGASDGLGNLDSLTFGEAIVDLNALLGGATCGRFGSVYLKSRSSDSFSSELKDFVAPKPVNLSNCSTISTVASGPVTVGQTITDTATLGEVSPGAGGTITFRLYDVGDTNCTGTPVFTDTAPVNGPGVYTSDPFTTAKVGVYRWIASYGGDGGNVAVSGACNDANEASTVSKASPTLPTTPSAGGTVGAVTLNDSATVTGGFNPSGTVTFRLWDPDQPSCTGTPRYSQTVTLSGGSASTSPGFQADKAGTWNWTAEYSGDDNNNAATSGCGAEAVVVSKASPSLGTTPSPTSGNVGVVLNDSATLTGGFNPGGTITFRLYDSDQATCTGTPRFTQTVGVSNGGASTTSGFTTDKVGTWRWTAEYSGDANNDTATSGCNDEQVTVARIPSTISTAQTVYPNDAATVTGTTGDVTFELFGPFATAGDVVCAGAAKFTQVVAQSGGVARTTNYPGVSGFYGVTDGAASEGWYGWRVTAAQTPTHEGRRSSCDEKVLIQITDYAGNGVKFP